MTENLIDQQKTRGDIRQVVVSHFLGELHHEAIRKNSALLSTGLGAVISGQFGRLRA
jgi:hypothetical protein